MALLLLFYTTAVSVVVLIAMFGVSTLVVYKPSLCDSRVSDELNMLSSQTFHVYFLRRIAKPYMAVVC